MILNYEKVNECIIVAIVGNVADIILLLMADICVDIVMFSLKDGPILNMINPSKNLEPVTIRIRTGLRRHNSVSRFLGRIRDNDGPIPVPGRP